MPESLTYNMDCLEAMRQMPDNAFDLAVVDPPYGDGTGSSAPPGKYWERFGGRFDKYRGPPPRTGTGYTGRGGTASRSTTSAHYQRKNCRKPDGDLGLRELAEPGRRSLQKNHCVGHSAGRRILR